MKKEFTEDRDMGDEHREKEPRIEVYRHTAVINYAGEKFVVVTTHIPTAGKPMLPVPVIKSLLKTLWDILGGGIFNGNPEIKLKEEN